MKSMTESGQAPNHYAATINTIKRETDQMNKQFSRTELLIGSQAMGRLADARVAIFGIGGVGGYVCEALARSGVGAFDLVDNDIIDITNLNRQIIATTKTLGMDKVEVMKERILEINPQARVRTYRCFYLPENSDAFPMEEYDYIVDAMDTVTAKIELIMRAREKGIPVISCMGTGNKLDPSALCITDLCKTKVCPLARVMRRELKKRGIHKLKVLYSEEIPIRRYTDSFLEKGPGDPACADGQGRDHIRRGIPGSISYVPAAAGLMIGGEVIKDLIAVDNNPEKE